MAAEARGTEILIVGGGIAGCSAAYYLASAGHAVTVVERGEVAGAASGLNAGMIDCVGWSERRDLQDHLTAGSLELFERVQLEEGEDCEFRRSGSLQAIHTPEQHEFTLRRVADMQGHGQRVELVTTRDARTLEPGFSPSLLGAMYSPLRGQADPMKGTRAFATLAARHGARILTGHAVTALAPRAGGGLPPPTPSPPRRPARAAAGPRAPPRARSTPTRSCWPRARGAPRSAPCSVSTSPSCRCVVRCGPPPRRRRRYSRPSPRQNPRTTGRAIRASIRRISPF